jgi:ABC-2 type transport system permease protein
VRRGLSNYALAVEWHARLLRPWLLSIFAFQLVTGVGIAVGLGFLLPQVTPSAALYFSAGAPTAMLLGLGLAILPSLVSRAKEVGTIDFIRTLPFPYLTYLLGDLTVWCVLTLPGAALSLTVASIRYDFTVQLSLLTVPVIILTLLTASSIGYAYALASPSLVISNIISNFMILSIFLLSPVNFPADRLPSPIQTLHDFLPFDSSASLMRASLEPADGTSLMRPLTILGLWAIAGLFLAYTAMSHRH